MPVKATELRCGNLVYLNTYKYDWNVIPMTKEVVKTEIVEVYNIWDEGINLSVCEGETDYNGFDNLDRRTINA